MSAHKRINPKVQGNDVNPAFDFWFENKTAKKRTIFISDCRTLFQKWLITKEREWLEYYGAQAIILDFIGSKDGLYSTFDKKDLNEITRFLKLDYNKHVYNK